MIWLALSLFELNVMEVFMQPKYFRKTTLMSKMCVIPGGFISKMSFVVAV